MTSPETLKPESGEEEGTPAEIAAEGKISRFNEWAEEEKSILERFTGRAKKFVAPLLLISSIGCGVKQETEGDAKPEPATKVEHVERAEQKGEWKHQQGRWVLEEEGKIKETTFRDPAEKGKAVWRQMQGRWVLEQDGKILKMSFEKPDELKK